MKQYMLSFVLLLAMSACMAQAAEHLQDTFTRIAHVGITHHIIDQHEQELLERACRGDYLSRPQRLLLLEICERVRQQAPARVTQDDVWTVCDCMKVQRDNSREPRPGDVEAPQEITLDSDDESEVSVDRSHGLGVSVGAGAGVDSDVSQSLDVAVNDSTVVSRDSTGGNIAVDNSRLRVQNSGGFNVVASGGTLDNILTSDAISDGINFDAGSGSVRLFSAMNAQGNTINNATLNNVSVSNINGISSSGNIIFNYDTDDTNNNKLEIQTGNAQTPLLRASPADISVLNRDLNMNGNDIDNVGNISGTSPIGVEDSLNLKSNSLNDVATIDGGADDVGFESPLYMNKNAVRLAGSGSDNHAIVYNGTVDGPEIRAFNTIRFTHTDTGNTIADFTNGSIDIQSNNIDNVAGIDGGGSPVVFGDTITMGGNSINSINTLTGGAGAQIVGLQNPNVDLESSDSVIANINKDGGATGTFFVVRNNGTTGGALFQVDQTGPVHILRGSLDMHNNDITGVADIEASQLRSSSSVDVLFDSDGSGTDAFDVNAGAGTSLFTVNFDGTASNIQSIDVHGNNLDNVANISGTSPIGVEDSLNLKSNALNDVATIDGGTDDVGFESPLYMNKNAVRLTGSGSDNHAIVYNGTVDGPEIRAFNTIRFTHTDTGNTIADFTNGSIDIQSNNIDNVAGIDGGGSPVVFGDTITMGGNSINSINDLSGGSGAQVVGLQSPNVDVESSDSVIVNINKNGGATGTSFVVRNQGTTGGDVFKVNQPGDVTIPVGPLDMNSGDIKAVASLDNAGSSISVNDTFDMQGNAMSNIATIDGGGSAISINDELHIATNAITSASELKFVYDTDDTNSAGGTNERFVIASGTGSQEEVFTIDRNAVDINTRDLDLNSNNVNNVASIDNGGSSILANDDIDLNSNTLRNANVNTQNIASQGGIAVNYDTDDSNGDAFEVQTGSGPTTVFRANDTDISILNRDLNMNGTNIDTVNTIFSGNGSSNSDSSLTFGTSLDATTIGSLNVNFNTDDVATDAFNVNGGSGATNLFTVSFDGTASNAQSIDFHSNNLNNVARIDNGGNPVSVNDDIDLNSNTLRNANVDVNGLSSDGSITVNYDTDDSNNDAFEVQTGSAATTIFRANNADISVFNRDINMNSNNISSINNLTGGSGTQIVGLQSPDVNLASSDAIIANINKDGTASGKFFVVRNQGTTGGDLFKVNQPGDVNIPAGPLDMNSNNINNAASLDNGGSPIAINDNLDMQENTITDVPTIQGQQSGSEPLTLQAGGPITINSDEGTTGNEPITLKRQGNNVIRVDANSEIDIFSTIDMQGNALNNVASLDGGGSDISFDSPIFMNDNAIRLRGSGSDNHSIQYNSTIDGPVIRAFDTIRLQQTNNDVTIADFSNGSIDVKGNNIDNVTGIDGGGTSVAFGDSINMNDNSLNDVNSIDGGSNQVFITPSVNVPQINSLSNIDVLFDSDASGGEAFDVNAGTGPTSLFTVNFDGTSGNTQTIDTHGNDVTNVGPTSTDLAPYLRSHIRADIQDTVDGNVVSGSSVLYARRLRINDDGDTLGSDMGPGTAFLETRDDPDDSTVDSLNFSNNTYVVPTSGYYHILRARVESPATATTLSFEINSTTIISASDGSTSEVTDIIKQLNAGDEVHFFAKNDTGGSETFNAFLHLRQIA